jgi:3-deoxy-D-arabino-heptulosonate 7-phosphate (DAHP) synthase
MELESILLSGINDNKPLVIAGPCSAETEEQVIQTAKELASRGINIFRAGIWKPRTKPGSFEGVGCIGLSWLQRVKKETGMLVATEVATQTHVMEAIDKEIDVLWIGARTSANPFAMQEIANAIASAEFTGSVLVKNPVSPDLELWIGAIERLYNVGIRKIGAVHRGFPSSEPSLYRNQPQWHIPIELRRRIPHLSILIDPSHIGGKRDLIASISQQAMDLNYDGLMIEAHFDPDTAWSDKEQQITPESLGLILKDLVIRDTNTSFEGLTELRQEIDSLDDKLFTILAKRMFVSQKIGQYKKENNMPILQSNRYDQLLKKRLQEAEDLKLNSSFIKKILEIIHEESVRQQIDEIKP